MIEVRLYRTDIEKAIEFDRKMRALKEGLTSTMRSTADYELIGFLGELAVEKYLLAIKKPFTKPDKENYTKHMGDDCDFIFDGGLKADVKSSKKYKLITLNENQYQKAQRHNIDYLIGVYFPRYLDLAIITGYGFWQDLVKKDEDYVYEDKKMAMYELPELKLKEFKVADIRVDF